MRSLQTWLRLCDWSSIMIPGIFFFPWNFGNVTFSSRVSSKITIMLKISLASYWTIPTPHHPSKTSSWSSVVLVNVEERNVQKQDDHTAQGSSVLDLAHWPKWFSFKRKGATMKQDDKWRRIMEISVSPSGEKNRPLSYAASLVSNICFGFLE